MSEEDTKAAVSMAMDDLRGKMDMSIDKLRAKWGRGEKHTHRDQQALIFATTLQRFGGTFVFTDAHRKLGIDTVWEAMAYESRPSKENMRQRIDALDEDAPKFKHGCARFVAELLDAWDDQVVYCVPTTPTGQRIDIVTWHRNYVVNENGKEGERTAYEIWTKRGDSRVTGQIGSVAKRLLRTDGKSVAIAKIAEMADKAMLGLPEKLKPGYREAELTNKAE